MGWRDNIGAARLSTVVEVLDDDEWPDGPGAQDLSRHVKSVDTYLNQRMRSADAHD